MVTLFEINENNWLALRALEVAEDQQRYLDSPLGVLARGYVYRDCRARVLGIAADGTAVGLLLVRDLDEEPACYDLQQFLIDRRFQGRGYGGAALTLLLRRLAEERAYPCVEVCVHRENTAALALFQRAGFADTGYIDEDAPDCLNLRCTFAPPEPITDTPVSNPAEPALHFFAERGIMEKTSWGKEQTMDREALRATFERKGYTVTFFDTGAEARDYLAGKIHLTSVGFGGSQTLYEIGLYEALSADNAVVWHRNMFSDDIKHLASHAKVYICSANAVAETGEIVNVDGNGNRLAMSMYGPDQVYFVIGKNKLVPDLPAALWRVKHVATPKNAKRFGAKTPCGDGLDCYECGSPQCMCKLVLTMNAAPGATPTELIFVDEALGY